MGFTEIDEEEYRDTLLQILEKKRKFVRAENDYQLKNKLARYAMTKGYESYLIWEIINDLI
jgi:regulatory protein